MRECAITYSGNATLKRGLKKPWQDIEKFLTTCSEFSFPTRVIIKLVESSKIPAAFFNQLFDHFSSKYEIYGAYYQADDKIHQWTTPLSDLEINMELLERYRPFPKNEIPSVSLQIRIDMLLLNENGDLLNYQGGKFYNNFVSRDKKEEYLGNSRIDVYLSERSSARVFLCFPYENLNEEFYNQVTFIEKHTPFKLSPKKWYIWNITKSKNGYKKSKLTI